MTSNNAPVTPTIPDPLPTRRRFLTTCALAGLAAVLPTSLTGGIRRSPNLLLGIDQLAGDGFSALQGKRVGLLTHPAGVNRHETPTMELLHRAPGVRLTALFGPEHGLYGDEKANVPVLDRRDERTGLPVFSLYGKFRRPTAAMLAGIDTMVIDLQDIGSRSYTYVSCMRYVLEELFKADKEAVVLDRPNPLGGRKIDGPPLEDRWQSYVGAFSVPYVHGLTIGELARMAQKEPGVLKIDDKTRRRGRLRVFPMKGWRRSMMWPETGLRWVPTSPAIPNLSAVLGYPMTGLGAQLGGFAHGYGTRLPFRLLQYRGKSPEVISAALTRRSIRGMEFPVINFQHRGKARRAVFTKVTDFGAARPTELSLHMMALACEWAPGNPFASASAAGRNLFNKHVGDPRVLEQLVHKGAGIDIPSLLADWQRYAHRFRSRSAAWRIY